MNFIVTVNPAGVSFPVAEGESILSAAIRHSVGLPYGCKDGACGSCRSQVMEGRVTRRLVQGEKVLTASDELAGFILTCCSTPQSDVVLESLLVPVSREYPVRKIPGRVSAIRRVTTDVAVLWLQLPPSQVMRYRPGQYIDILLANGGRRSYSIATAPHLQETTPGFELHIRHLPGGKFTDHVFGSLKANEILRFEGPFGTFFLREDSDKPVVLLASGTGMAPIKSFLEHMEHKRIDRPIVLYWGARRLEDLYLHSWALEFEKRCPTLRYVPVLSHSSPEENWQGRRGLVHQAVMADLPDLRGYQVYACGSPLMVEAARHDFKLQCGLPSNEFYADAFVSEADKHKAST